MNILLFHPDKETRDMISFCLESEDGLNVTLAESAQSAIEHFLDENPIDLVLSCQHQTTDKLFKYLLSTGAQIPVIILGDGFSEEFEAYPDLKILAQMPVADAAEKLVPLFQRNFKEIIQSGESNEYCKIATSLLVRVIPLKSDIYIRLSSVKFVKLFKAGAVFTAEDLERYLVRKKIAYLYIKKSASKEFVKKFSQDLSGLVEQAQVGDPELINTVAQVHDLVLDLSHSLGFNDQVKEIAKANVKLALKAIGSSPKLTKMLSYSQMKNKNYISSHSVLIANVACSIAAQMKWPSDSTFHKLVIASLFHDIVFQEPHLAKISDKRQLVAMENALGAEKCEHIRQHPIKASEMIKDMNEVPADAHIIIAQHHEKPDGEGFPMGLKSHQIAPLAAVFIVAHDILDAFGEEKGNFKLQSFLKRSESVYQSGTFRQIWKALTHFDEIETTSEEDPSAA